MIRTQVQLTEKQMNSLRKLAAKYQISVSDLVRQGVDAVLQSAIPVSEEELRQRAIAAAGRFRSGLRDLSTQHDKYLIEAFDS